MYTIGKFEFESFKYTPGHRANYAILTKPGNREWGLKYSPAYSYSSEHDVLKKFSHPQIPKRKYCDQGQLYQDGKEVLREHYIVLQHMEGDDIVQHYKDKGIPDLNEIGNVVKYFVSVADPLIYLHTKKKHIHTDLKPGHLLVDFETGIVSLIDLELSIKIGSVMKGMTKEYAAPEQKLMMKLMNELPEGVSEKSLVGDIIIDGRADLYTIGLIMYEVLTGKVRADSKESPLEINSAVPQKLNDIVLALMEDDQNNRIASAESFKSELLSV